MSSSIDQRVVQMQFDNSDFEKNAQESMTTLEKLKSKLTFSESSKSLEQFASSVSNFAFTGMISGIDEVRYRFSALQIMGITAIQNITNAAINTGKNLLHNMTSSVTTGGLNRALNLESAKFTLKGIGIAWDSVKDDIDYGVKDTAYGLDAAAKAASSLAASGVKVGKDMKQSLRGISGVAAMTNSDYSSIADVFTTVASNGKLMTMQLRQLSARGLNAAATLAKSMGKSEAEINDMVTKGKISYKDFAKAMDEAFGEHAKDANKTFTGAMSNVKAALARIGADVASEQLVNFRKVLNALRRVINATHSAIGPIIQDINSFVGGKADKLYNFLKSFVVVTKNADGSTTSKLIDPVVNSINNFRDAAHNMGSFVSSILTPIGDAFKSVFSPVTAETIERVSEKLSEFTSKFKISSEMGIRLKHTFEGVFAVFDIIGQAFSALIRVITPGLKSLGLDKLIQQLSIGTSDIGINLKKLAESWKENDTLYKLFKNIADSLGSAKDKVIDFIDRFTGIKSILPNVKNLGDLFELIREKASNIPKAIGGIAKKIKEFFSSLKQGDEDTKDTPDTLDKVGKAFDSIGKVFKIVGKVIADIAESLGGNFIEIMKNFKFIDLIKGISAGIRLGMLKQLFDILNSFSKSVSPGPILSTAKSVAIMAASLIFLSSVDADAMNNALGALASILFMLSAALVLLQKTNTANSSIADLNPLQKLMNTINKLNGTSLFGQVKGLIGLAAAVLIVTGAVMKLSKLKPEQMAQGIVGITALLLALTLTVNKLNPEGLSKSALGIISLSIGIRILVGAVKSLAKIDVESMFQGLVGVAALLLGISKFSQSLTNSKGLLAAAIAMPLIAVSLLIFSSAVKSFGKMDTDSLFQGMASIAALLGGIVIFNNYLKDTAKLMAAAAAMLVLGAAINIITLAVKSLGGMGMEQLWQGLVGVAAALAAIVVAVNGMSGAMSGAAALLVVAGALAVLTPQLILLSLVPFEKMLQALAVFALALGGLAIAATLFAASAEFIFIGAAAIAALGAAAMVAGGGIAIIGIGIATLAIALTAGAGVIVAGVSAIAVGLANLIPTVATALANGIVTFVVTLMQGGAKILSTLGQLLMSLLRTIATFIGPIASMGVKLLASFISGIASNIGAIAQSGAQIIAGFIMGVASNIGNIVMAGIYLVTQLINGIASGINQNGGAILQAVGNLLLSVAGLMIEAIAQIVGGIPVIGGKLKSGLEAIKKDITSSLDAPLGEEVGKNIASGAEEGLNDLPEKTEEKSQEAAEGLDSPLADLDIGSTTSTLATNALSGIDGLPEDFGKVGSDAMSSLMGSFSLDDSSGALGGIKNSLSGSLDGLKTVGESKGSDLGSGVATGIEKKGKDVQSKAKGVGEKGATSVKNTRPKYVESGKWAAGGIVSGVGSMEESIRRKFAHLGTIGTNAYRANLKISSPSKVMEENGKWTVLGIVKGLTKYMGQIETAGSEMGNRTRDAIYNPLKGVYDYLDVNLDFDPTITPVMDLSNVSRGIDSLNGAFGDREIQIGASVGNLSRLSSNIDLNQNGNNLAVLNALSDIKKGIIGIKSNSYTINGLTYDDGSNIANAMQAIANAAIIEGRM